MTTRANDEAGDPHRGLHDLVARHLDGDLSAAEQRLLAERLAGSPAARRALARFLRLEGATIRLAAAGLLGGSSAADSTPPADGSREPAPEAFVDEPRAACRPRAAPSVVGTVAEPVAAPARQPRPATPALAWGLVAAIACVAAVALLPRPGFPPRSDVARGVSARNTVPRGEIGVVADRWIEVRRTREPVEVAMTGPTFGDDTIGDAAAPPTDPPSDVASDTATEGGPPPAWLVAALADELAEPANPDAS
jgi:hypothetical protein